MSALENKISNCIKKPSIYLKYVDDMLIFTNDTSEISMQQDTFQKIQFLILLWD